MRMKGILLDHELAPYNYRLLLTDSRATWLQLRKKYSPKRKPYKLTTCGVVHLADDDKHVIVGMFEGVGMDTLVHELAHVCIYVFEQIGAKVEDATTEPFAYLLDHTFTACRNALNDHAERAMRKKRSRK